METVNPQEKKYDFLEYNVVCYYMSSDLPSVRKFGEWTISWLIEKAKGYYTTWALVIQRLEVREIKTDKLIHTEEVTPKNTPMQTIAEAMALKEVNRLRKKPLEKLSVKNVNAALVKVGAVRYGKHFREKNN